MGDFLNHISDIWMEQERKRNRNTKRKYSHVSHFYAYASIQ